MGKSIMCSSELFDMLRVYQGLDMLGKEGGQVNWRTATQKPIGVLDALLIPQETFNQIFYDSPWAMLISRAEDGSIIEVNKPFCELSGCSREQLLDAGFARNTLYKRTHRQILHEIMNRGRVVNREVSFYDYCSLERHCLLNSELIQFREESFLLSALLEVNEPRQSARDDSGLQLQQMAELAASLAHEVRNPMTTVRGFLQIMREKDEYAVDYADIDLMLTEIDQANRAISQLLYLAREKTLELKPGCLNRLITALLPLLENSATRQNKKIEAVLHDINSFPMDEQEMTQLIITLVNNSLEVLSPGYKLVIATLRQNDQTILIGTSRVDDDIIMPPVMRGSESERATGNGLSLCHSIAARHNAILQFGNSCQEDIFKLIFPNSVV
ncbi:MAG: PAS domain-containing sensor histidine kinase [Syntrophomonadaceae bacterium]